MLPCAAFAMKRHVPASGDSTLPSFCPNYATVRPDINGCIPVIDHSHHYPVIVPWSIITQPNGWSTGLIIT
jgi:hypothetical protein